MKRLGLVICLLTVAACNGDRSMFVTENERASQIATIGWLSLVGFTVVSAIMWGLLIWAVRRRPGSFEEHAPVDLDDGKGWIIVGGVVIPVITFLSLLILSVIRMHSAAAVVHTHHHGDMRPDMRVIGHRWWWEVQYLADEPGEIIEDANEIHIPTGRPVTIELQSADVIHSFWVPNIHGKVDLIPGYKNYITLQADEPGVYPGQCAEFCGAQHSNMKLLVVADPPARFAEWRTAEAAPAAAPSTEKAILGKQVFEGKPCAACHGIRGTRAAGSFGPDLTHVGSRHAIASEMLPPNRAYFSAWVTRPHSLKPGVEMPDMAAMTGEELDALVSYLMELK